jgi:hypothetical protein
MVMTAAMAKGGDSTTISEKSQAMRISAFTSVSVLSESVKEITNVGCILFSLWVRMRIAV